MLKSLKQYLKYGKYYVGIELTNVSDESGLLVTVLKASKDEVTIQSQEQYNTIESVVEAIPKHSPIVLCINNQQVLTKEVNSSNFIDATKSALTAFPNINVEDFYVEVLVQDGKAFVSICRKTYVDDLLTEYSKHKIHIIDIHLGNLPIALLKNYIDEAEINTSNAKIILNQHKQVEAIQSEQVSTETQHQINGLQTSSTQLLALSSALQIFMSKSADIISNTETKTKELWSNFSTARLVSQTLRIGGFALLGLLLINFFVFNYYLNKSNVLEEVASVNLSAKERLLALKADVDKKKTMVDDLLRSQGSTASLYLNEVIQQKPNAVLLSGFNYQPLEKRIKKDKAITLQTQTIEVSGETNNNDAFSSWIANLEQLSWVDKVSIIDFRATSKSKEAFTIKIHLHYD